MRQPIACPDCASHDRANWRTTCQWVEPEGSRGADAPCSCEAYADRTYEQDRGKARWVFLALALILICGLALASLSGCATLEAIRNVDK